MRSLKPFAILEAPDDSEPDREAVEAAEVELPEPAEVAAAHSGRPPRPCVVCGVTLPIGRKKTHLGECRLELRRRMQQHRRQRRR